MPAIQGPATSANSPAKDGITLRVAVAFLPRTVRNLVRMLKPLGLELFTRPLTIANGRSGTQVFFGHFPSKAAARLYIKNLPAELQARGGPIVLPVGSIRER